MDENIIVVSDLHLGAPSSLLSLPSVRLRLIEKLRQFGEVNALVLLGDILDLTRAPRSDAWNTTISFFSEVIAGNISHFNKSRIYYIPGNHDHHLWMMLIEQRDIVSPLEAALLSDESKMLRSVGLTPVKIASGEFCPNKKTFVHALFPRAVQDRLRIEYPFLRVRIGDKTVFFHHGHYFDSRITPLARKVAKKYKGDIEKVEECNSLFIESIFYLASIGRTTRNFTMGTYWRYKAIVSEFVGLLRKLGISLDKPTGQTVGGLPLKLMRDMMYFLFEESCYTLVLGHTHNVDEAHIASGTIDIYNTGGWIIEENDDSVSPGILRIVNSEFQWVPFEIKPEEIQKVKAQAENLNPVRKK